MAEQSVAAGNEERGKQLAAAAVTYPTTTVVPDEVFTTMRYEARGISLQEMHIDRLQRSVQSMKDYFPKHWSQCNLAQPSALEGIIQEKVIEEAANLPHSSSHRVRISIDQSGRIKIAVFAMANPSSIENTDVDARLTVRLDSKTQEAFNIPAVLYNNKTAYREMYDEARHRVGATLMPSADGSGSVGPCFEVLMLAESAHDDKKTVVISESSIANVILVHHDTGQVLTPPADELLLLPGLFRAELLARRIIAEQHIPIDQLRTDLETGAASLYLCNALRGIIPVRLIE